MALKIGRSKRWTDTTRDALQYFAAKAGLPERLVLNSAKETIDRFRQVWKQEKNNLALSRTAIQAIDKHMARIPLVTEL
jgi:serine/threonine-protein kinase HipA